MSRRDEEKKPCTTNSQLQGIPVRNNPVNPTIPPKLVILFRLTFMYRNWKKPITNPTMKIPNMKTTTPTDISANIGIFASNIFRMNRIKNDNEAIRTIARIWASQFLKLGGENSSIEIRSGELVSDSIMDFRLLLNVLMVLNAFWLDIY